jgi:peptidoglycan hydrolase CwlO-like protein
MISNVGKIVSSKTDDSILSQISTLQSQLKELNGALSETSNNNINKLSEEMSNLNNNIEILKETISE